MLVIYILNNNNYNCVFILNKIVVWSFGFNFFLYYFDYYY